MICSGRLVSYIQMAKQESLSGVFDLMMIAFLWLFIGILARGKSLSVFLHKILVT